MVKVSVDWEHLRKLFTQADADKCYYLDQRTGGILGIAMWSEEEVFVADDWEHMKRIEPLTAHDERGFMLDFARSVEDQPLSLQLMDILMRRGAVKHFHEMVAAHPPLEGSWKNHRQTALDEHIRAWLKTLGIEAQ